MDLKEKARSAFATLMLHNQNELGAINRAATAKAWGLDPDKFATPYTQQNITTNTNGSALWPLILGAVLSSGLIGTGAGLAAWFCQPAEPKVVDRVTEKVWDSAVDLVVEPPQGQ